MTPISDVDGGEGKALPVSQDRATAVEPVPVSPLRDGIPSAARGRGTIFYVSSEQAQEPRTGECIAGHWWSVHPEYGLAFYAQLTGYAASEAPSPQCNQSEGTARLLANKLYPDHEVRQVPVVFMRHAERAMAALRAQAIEARRVETGTGSIEDESAVPQGCAQTPPAASLRARRER